MKEALVTIVDGKAVTTSLKVAEVFGKRHDHVLRAIKEIAAPNFGGSEAPADFVQLNFKRGTYLDANQQERPMYHITRDGFTLLAMGFTGKKAMQFKLAYIEAFNRMEEELKHPARMTPEEALLAMADIIVPGGREAFLAGQVADLLESTRLMLLALNRRVARGENVPPHILKYAWNLANCSRMRERPIITVTEPEQELINVFSLFDKGTRYKKSTIYGAYCDRCKGTLLSPRSFWPRARRVVRLSEVRTADGRYVVIEEM